MPANLTPRYLKAESQLREAISAEERLACLQEMLRQIPKHKGTDRLQADIKSKIARIKEDLSRPSTPSKTHALSIAKQGAGRVVLIGPPNSGKSQLLASLTRATPEIADYPFTTRVPLPGMIDLEKISIQLIDLPATTGDHIEGNCLDLIRSADMAFLVIGLANPNVLVETGQLIRRFQDGKTKFGPETHFDPREVGVMRIATIALLNQCDHPHSKDLCDTLIRALPSGVESILCSGLTGLGLDAVRCALSRKFCT